MRGVCESSRCDEVTMYTGNDDNIVSDFLFKAGPAITDMNSAVFDSVNNFAGCISGIHEVLHRQGLMKNIICLDEIEKLSR